MVSIERATQTEVDALTKLLQRQFDEHQIDVSVDVLREAITKVLQSDRWGLFLVAREESQIIGVAAISYAWTLEHGGKSAWLDELYVIPECRNTGVGSALLERTIEEVQKEGCRAIDLEVKEQHHRAEHLYERKGFRRIKRVRMVWRVVG